MRNAMRNRNPRGFTLIELLVVVAIIALLISILLPSLGKARNLAKTAKCAANLHGIAQSQATYAGTWNDAIAGSAKTSGSIAFSNITTGTHNASFSSINPPPIFQVFDWWSPTGEIMNL